MTEVQNAFNKHALPCVIIETLNGSDWSFHFLAALLPLAIEQEFGHFVKGKIRLPLPGIEPQIFWPVAGYYSD